MRNIIFALGVCLFFFVLQSRGQEQRLIIPFYGLHFDGGIQPDSTFNLSDTLSTVSVIAWYKKVEEQQYNVVIDSLRSFRNKYELNDWLYYQLIRKVSESLVAKSLDYNAYTLYKWYFLSASGFDARLAISGSHLIFYILNEEDIADVPFFTLADKKYMCLNIHDFEPFEMHAIPLVLKVKGAIHPFSYAVTKLPEFEPDHYVTKNYDFTYKYQPYHFTLVFNTELKALFKNYPVLDFGAYFNIPLSKATYQSLIPLLKTNLKGMDRIQGVDYLMRFTRYAFLYENDQTNFGKEKRLSPEETLFSPYSDCDDRAGLFFYLVREIYDMPMIALLYPGHLTIAVAFERPFGTIVTYAGKQYTICEPTPQAIDLALGASVFSAGSSYEVVYQYEPKVVR